MGGNLAAATITILNGPEVRYCLRTSLPKGTPP